MNSHLEDISDHIPRDLLMDAERVVDGQFCILAIWNWYAASHGVADAAYQRPLVSATLEYSSIDSSFIFDSKMNYYTRVRWSRYRGQLRLEHADQCHPTS